jgi:ribosomal protein S18 acetylase RimI-like enzyme
VEELPGPRSLVRLAYDPAGSCVGITVPGLRPWGADISYVGVLPEHRGKGYADELLLEASHLLVEGGATEIVAATMWATRRWRRRSPAAGTWWSTG